MARQEEREKENRATEKEFPAGTVARTNRSNKRFLLDTYVKAELVQETDKGKVYRVTHLVMGGGEFDSPWIYEADQDIAP